MVTAPVILVQHFCCFGANGVLMNIFEEADQVGFSIAENCFVSALEEMANSAVFSIIVHGIRLIEALHDLGKGNALGFDEHMNVIVHENVCVNTATRSVLIGCEKQEILLEISGVAKYPLALVAADYDVVECAFIFDAGFARHGMKITKSGTDVNISCFKSDPNRLTAD